VGARHDNGGGRVNAVWDVLVGAVAVGLAAMATVLLARHLAEQSRTEA
jgi:hypothetical protein